MMNNPLAPKPVKLPKRIKVEQTHDELNIRFAWNRFMGTLGLIALLGISSLVYSQIIDNIPFQTWDLTVSDFWGTLQAEAGTVDNQDLLIAGLVMTLVGWLVIHLFINAIAHIFNTTIITVNSKQIKIRHRPIPASFGVTVNSNDIAEITTKKRVVTGSGGDQISYEVHALTHAKKRKKLLRRLPELQQAVFIKQQIEQFLGL